MSVKVRGHKAVWRGPPPPHSLQHFIVSSTMTLIRPSQTAVKSATPDGVLVSSNPCVYPRF